MRRLPALLEKALRLIGSGVGSEARLIAAEVKGLYYKVGD
jgi:hypothetical protein